ncbi:MAG: M56 family metallopeptidase [Planctomycetota bacterium]
MMMSSASPGWALLSGAWMITYLFHSTLLLGCVWLLTRFGRIRQEALRETLWKLALTVGIITASLQILFEIRPLGGQIPLYGNAPSQTMAYGLREADAAAHPALTSTRSPRTRLSTSSSDPSIAVPSGPRLLPLEADSPGKAEILDAEDASHSACSSPLETVAEPKGKTRETPAIAASNPPVLHFVDEKISDSSGALLVSSLYMAAFLAVSAMLTLAWVRLKKLLEGRKEIESGPLRERLNLLCRKAGLGRNVGLSVCRQASIPMAIGIFRPEICLPERALSGLTGAEQNSMLAHELAHLAHRDPLWLFLFRVIENLFFFQPLNRLGRHAWQELAEYRCDAWAADLQGGGLPLARCLTRVAEWVIEPLRGAPVHSMAGNPSSLKLRVKRLLDRAHSERRSLRTSWQVLILVGLLFFVTSAAPVVVLTSPEQPDSEEASSASVEPGAHDSHDPALELAVARAHSGHEETLLYPVEEKMRDPGSQPVLSVSLHALEEELYSLERDVRALKESLSGSDVTAGVLQLIELAQVRITELHSKRERIQALLPLVVDESELYTVREYESKEMMKGENDHE